MAKVRSKFSVLEVQEMAEALNIKIQRMAPSWGWYEKVADGTRRLFAKTNDLAFEKLNELKSQMAVNKKAMKSWHSSAPAAILFDGVDFDVLLAVAPSKAALIRMLDAIFECGPGTGKKSHRCRVNKYWQADLPTGLSGVNRSESGVWVSKGSFVSKLNKS